MLTIFTIDPAFLTAATGYIGDTFTELQLLIALVIGLPLAFWGIRKVVGLVRAR